MPTGGSSGMKKQASVLTDGESASVRIFNMDMLKNKFFKREIEQYHDSTLFLTNDDEIISICRYYDWNKEAMTNDWFDRQDKLRLEIGLDYDTNLVKKFPHINDSLAENNSGYCGIMVCEFDTEENDPEMVPKWLKCGH